MKALLIGSGLAALALALYLVGLIFEFEYPHWPLLYQVRHARSVEGVPVREILERKYGAKAGEAHWHTCGYCIGRQGRSDDLVSVDLQSPGGGATYLFAYSRKRKEIVPASDATAAAFPDLMPKGDSLTGARSGISIGGYEEVKIPLQWSQEGAR